MPLFNERMRKTMNNTFELNNNVIVAKKFDFNTVCDLEDLGVSLQDAQKKPTAMVRAYVALCANTTITVAGQMLEAHIANGGNFDDIINVMTKEMETSDFFRNLNQPKTVAKKTSKAQGKTE